MTKLDAPNTDLERVLESIRNAFGDRCVPVTIPDALGPKLTRVVDVMRSCNSPISVAKVG